MALCVNTDLIIRIPTKKSSCFFYLIVNMNDKLKQRNLSKFQEKIDVQNTT